MLAEGNEVIVVWIIVGVLTLGGIVEVSTNFYKCRREKIAFDDCVKFGGSHGYCRNKTMKHDCEE